jgi:hypothetical protein
MITKFGSTLKIKKTYFMLSSLPFPEYHLVGNGSRAGFRVHGSLGLHLAAHVPRK